MIIELTSSLKPIKDIEQDAESYLQLPFQSWAFLNTWSQTIARKHQYEPFAVTVKDHSGVIQMALPLTIVKEHHVKKLLFMGEPFADYNLPIFRISFLKQITQDRTNMFNELWHEIIEQLPSFDIIDFRKMPTVIGGHKNPMPALHSICQSDKIALHVIGDDWSHYYQQSIPPKVRNDSKRQFKRLANFGEVKFAIADNAEDYSKIIDCLLTQKSARYRAIGSPDHFAIPEYREFFLTYPHYSAHTCALWVGDEIAATHWGLRDDLRFYYLMPSFDDAKWGKYSVGRLLLEQLLEWCYQEKFEIFDFTIGDESYKKLWTNGENSIERFIQHGSLLGQTFHLMHSVRRAINHNLR